MTQKLQGAISKKRGCIPSFYSSISSLRKKKQAKQKNTANIIHLFLGCPKQASLTETKSKNQRPNTSPWGTSACSARHVALKTSRFASARWPFKVAQLELKRCASCTW